MIPAASEREPTAQEVVAELRRVTALFQLHTIATVIHGKPIPFAIPTGARNLGEGA